MPFDAIHPTEERKRLRRACGTALAVELFFFAVLGLGNLPIFHNRFDSAQYVDVQMVQLPANSHLAGAQVVQPDEDIVYNPHHRRRKLKPKKAQPPKPEQNKVDAGPALGPTHGPVALYAPQPAIPNYLRDENLRTSVVIEFLVTTQGQVTPRLLVSSGNDSLDAIALATAEKWKFKPAAQNNVPIDSKTRLRILFEVQ
ncbi:MAG: energy transducer TonB [bacterium]